MHWIEPSETDIKSVALEMSIWYAVEPFHINSWRLKLTP